MKVFGVSIDSALHLRGHGVVYGDAPDLSVFAPKVPATTIGRVVFVIAAFISYTKKKICSEL